MFPEYLDTENYYMHREIRINRFRTLEENKIKDNEIIILNSLDD